MSRPNILILYTDQQRFDALRAAGNPDIHTPCLDRLAGEGAHVSRCIVQSPVCMPSRVSFLSGQYPSRLRITHMGVPVPTDTLTLPRLLRDAGYVTANFGKLHFQPHAARDWRQPYPDYGFDEMAVSDEPGCYPDAYRAWVAARAPEQLDRISFGLPPATKARVQALEGTAYPDDQAFRTGDGILHPVRGEGWRQIYPFAADDDLTHTAFVADRTIDFLRRRRDQRFVCIAGFFAPHSPWVAPRRFFDLYDPETLTLPTFPTALDGQRDEKFGDEQLRRCMHGYYAMVSEVDHHVGRILDTLGDLGLADETLVLFTSDHGEWLGEHLRYGKGYPAHDCVSRVPLLMRWPAAGWTTDRIDALVEQVDVLPTLLDAAEVQAPQTLQGESLTPLLQGRTTRHKEAALTEFAGWKALRTERYRYLCCADDRGELLFDLAQSHGEYRNVAADPAYGDALSQMRGALARKCVAIERPIPRPLPY